MTIRLLSTALIAISLASCDKARNIVTKTTSAVKEQIAATTGTKESSKIDEKLQQLVDQTPEGVIFRKDLPFPTRLEVRTTRRHELSARLFQSSAIGQNATSVNGTQVTVTKLERADPQVRYKLEQSSFSVPSTDDPEGETKNISNPLESIAPSNKPIIFTKSNGTWTTDESEGFRAAVLSKNLSPVLDDLLIENALAPRALWFAKRRIQIGDELDIAGKSLPMLLAGSAKGSFHLKLEAIEGVEGHPCGVFSVTGDFTRKQFPDFEGNLTDEDISIQSGKLWLSLLYPVILKEELDTIQTFKSGGQGGLSGRGQGTVKISVIRSWKPLAP